MLGQHWVAAGDTTVFTFRVRTSVSVESLPGFFPMFFPDFPDFLLRPLLGSLLIMYALWLITMLLWDRNQLIVCCSLQQLVAEHRVR